MDITSYLLGKNSAGGGGGSDLDWSALGYNPAPQPIVNDYNYSLQIQQSWVPSTNIEYRYSSNKELVYMPFVDTSMVVAFRAVFYYCSNLKAIPLLDTSSATTFEKLFMGCSNLQILPQLNTSKIKNFNKMFTDNGSKNLTNESLNNLLAMCINATSYTGTKTLSELGITSSSQPSSKIQALSNYQAFIDAGWTIGY